MARRASSSVGCQPWYIPMNIHASSGNSSSDGGLLPLCDGFLSTKFESALMDDDGAGCGCLPDCGGVSYEANVDSGMVDEELECGEEGNHGAFFANDPFSLVEQVREATSLHTPPLYYNFVLNLRRLARGRAAASGFPWPW